MTSGSDLPGVFALIFHSKRVVHQVVGHGARPIRDQHLHRGQPGGVADDPPSTAAAAGHQSSEPVAGAFDTPVVAVRAIHCCHSFGHAVQLGRRALAAVHQPAAEPGVRETRGHVVGRAQPRGHVVHQPTADARSLFRAASVVVQRLQRPALLRRA